jgi:predicted TIM-barrel fold metal-dependent hydrolase
MAAYMGQIVDVDIHHRPKVDSELAPYLSKPWRELITGNGMMSVSLKPPQATPAGMLDNGARRRDSYPRDGSSPGSDYDTLRTQLLDPFNYYKGVLTWDLGEYACHTNPYFAVEVCRAANDWNAEHWLSRDSRLTSVIIVPSATPEEATKELRRAARNQQMVGVMMSGNPIGRPFGDPHFHPIYEVAAELGLVVSVHVSGGDRPNSTTSVGGPRGTAIEHITQLAQSGMHHLSSMIVHGVFEKYPGLRIMLTEYGLAWIPAFLWRMDHEFDLLRRESPWVKKLPSEYIRENVRFSTQPLEEGPDRHSLIQVLETIPGIEDLLCFSTDYPHMTMDDPTYVRRILPTSWHQKVFVENACKAYAWPVPTNDAVAAQR